ncbi:helix-turn-helix transcriptional regulator [[Clostridium] spiroforme]|nr:helix-turn-helix transcriptional regulator [Thomasclavelia spiroformis]MBM6881305.1 helix-turn-helix transcriptional regulator [Thomasclavelia spiroformis]
MFLFKTNGIKHSITIDLICKKAGISRSKCCKLFLQFTKDTMLDYLVHYRINKSIQFLKNTHLSILEISQMCGFTSPSYYTSVFKKETGLTPKAYRL